MTKVFTDRSNFPELTADEILSALLPATGYARHLQPAGLPCIAAQRAAPIWRQSFDALRFGLPRRRCGSSVDKDTSAFLVWGATAKANRLARAVIQAWQLSKTYWVRWSKAVLPR